MKNPPKQQPKGNGAGNNARGIKVLGRAPAVAYTHCRGTGAVKTLIYTTCGGRGFVSQPLSPTVSCPLCKGLGDDASAPAMACLKCRGTGWMINQVRKEKWVHE